jgi:FKBP-type peptidyl-prolyl cis-trans isomerase (trigger factor)
MMTRDELWRRYVMAYDVEVSEEAIENERAYIELDLRHRMQYDRLSGGGAHLFPGQELAEQEDELLAAATFEAKEPLVVRELASRLGLEVMPAELEAEAKTIAESQQTTVEALRSFFGDDLAMLRRDVIERKAIDWAVTDGE